MKYSPQRRRMFFSEGALVDALLNRRFDEFSVCVWRAKNVWLVKDRRPFQTVVYGAQLEKDDLMRHMWE
jgi:hypothetical protein